jgi:protoporphyrinogen oxidase
LLPDQKKHITILGAGLAGLSAAWHLAKWGNSVRVIEREPEVGGMTLTVRKGDYRFDLGPHRFYSKDQYVLDKVQGLLGNELLTVDRISHIHLNGQFLDYPPNIANLLRCMNLKTSLRCLLDYIGTTRNGNSVGESEIDFKTWVVNRFGNHLYEIYFGPYTEKVWGVPPQYLSAELGRRRITVPNLTNVLLRLIIPNYGDQKTYTDHFWYPEPGIGRITERMAEEILQHGGELLLGHKVEKLYLEQDRVVEVVVDDGGGLKYLPCQEVLSTIPIPLLLESMDPAQKDLIDQAKKISFRSLIFVFLMLNRPQIGKAHWLYFPDIEFIFNRVSEPSMFSPGHAPPDKTSLCVEITCEEGDELWSLSQEDLSKRVVGDLTRVGLIKSDQVEAVFTYHFPWGYPIYTIKYKEILKYLLSSVDQITNLTTFGRQGSFDYSSMSEAIANGYKIAKLVSMRPAIKTTNSVEVNLT